MIMFFLNLAIAIGLFYLGVHATSCAIAKFIVESSDAEILAKIKEIKKEAEGATNDY